MEMEMEMEMVMAMEMEMVMVMAMEMNNFLLLPPEITTDILSRLPTDSVLECKLVCKTWRSLIDHPSFVNAHTRHIFLNDSSASMGFFISTHIIGGTGEEFKLHLGEYNEEDDDEVIPFKLSKPITHHPYPLETINLNLTCQFDTVNIISCNGLIFTASSVHPLDILFIYNLFTKEYLDLLHTFVAGCISFEVYFECFIANGFGYHHSTNEYKIVRVCYSFASQGIGHVSVYTLGSGKWRSKGEIPYSLFGRNPGVFANGVIYWLERHDKQKGNKRIVSFDLGDEEFRIVPSPVPQTRDVQLGVLRGYLCVISPKYVNGKSSSDDSDVWILKNKECSSWTRKFNVPWKCDLGELVGISKGGKILLHSNADGCLFSYDPRTESLHGVKNAPALESYHMIPYTKSFVSLKELGEEDAKCMDMPSSDSFEFGLKAQIMAILVSMVKYFEFRG